MSGSEYAGGECGWAMANGKDENNRKEEEVGEWMGGATEELNPALAELRG